MLKIELKIVSIIISLFMVGLMISCSSEEKTSDLNLVENNLARKIVFQESTYLLNTDNSVSKYELEEFKYDLLLPIKRDNINIVKNITSKNSNQDSYLIENVVTGEFIRLTNIIDNGDYYTFDVLNNLGDSFIGLEYYGELDLTSSKCPPCVVGIVAIIAGAVVELASSSPLEDCQVAASNLNCSGGANAYMEFEEGWFSTSFSIGCR